jgi:hypothetical protein
MSARPHAGSRLRNPRELPPNDGIIGAARQRSPCLAKNPRRFRITGSAALTSGHTRKGEVSTKAGTDHHGRAIHAAC